MRRVIAVILCAALAEAHVAPLGQQKATRGGFTAPPMHVNPQRTQISQGFTSYRSPTSPASPQGRFQSVVMQATPAEEAADWIGAWKAKQGGLAKTSGASASSASMGDSTTNVYAGSTSSCGSGPACTFTSEKAEICVSNVPYDQTKFWVAMPGKGAGEFVGNTDEAGEWKQTAQCMSIWEVGAPSMIFGERTKGSFLFPNVDFYTWFQSFAKRVKYGFVDDVVVCESVPTTVLDSDWSKEMYETCEITRKIRPFGGDAKRGDGGRIETLDTNMKCQRFRNAIEKVCATCAGQAPGTPAYDSLLGKCAAIGVAPASAAGLAPESSGTSAVLIFLSSFMLTLIGLSKVFRGSRKPTDGLEEPILLKA